MPTLHARLGCNSEWWQQLRWVWAFVEVMFHKPEGRGSVSGAESPTTPPLVSGEARRGPKC